jgi:hypothetical protein
MQIMDIGIPAWQIELPGGMILKMTSCQGVLIVPDPEPEVEVEAKWPTSRTPEPEVPNLDLELAEEE